MKTQPCLSANKAGYGSATAVNWSIMTYFNRPGLWPMTFHSTITTSNFKTAVL